MVGWLNIAIYATKVLREGRKVGFCNNTLWYALRDVGLRPCEKVPKPCLSQKNVQERLRFATIYKGWTIEDWKKVVFSSETKINSFSLNQEDLVLGQ